MMKIAKATAFLIIALCGSAAAITRNQIVALASASQVAPTPYVQVPPCGFTGASDNTAAIKAAVDAATYVINGLRYGGTVMVPAGVCVISSTITFNNVNGINFVGVGQATQFKWIGDASSPMFELVDTRQAELADFHINGNSSAHLATAIQSIASGGGTWASSKTSFRNIVIDGVVNYIAKGFEIGGSGIDLDNDMFLFENTDVSNYSNIAYSQEFSQVFDVSFINASCHGNGVGGIGVSANNSGSSGGNFHWQGGFCGGNLQEDFYLAATNQGTFSISYASFENSNRFIVGGGPTGAGYQTIVDGVRWFSNGLNADGIAVDFESPGPLIIRNSVLGTTRSAPTTQALKVKLTQNTAGGVRPFYIFEGDIFNTSLTSVAAIFPNLPPSVLSGTIAQTDNTQSDVIVLSN